MGSRGRGSIRSRLSPLWRKAPFALVWHRSALAAVLVAGFLVALSASSAPFVTTASASAELKDNLTGLSPLATGLEVQSIALSTGRLPALVAQADRQEQAFGSLAGRFHLEPGIFTLESDPAAPFIVTGASGQVQVLLMARTGVLAHVQVLAQTSGSGAWVSDLTAQSAHVRPGSLIHLTTVTQFSSSNLTLRVKGIYRALDRSTPGPYWANFLPQILLQGADPPPPARYIFLSRNALLAAAHGLSTTRVQRFQGRVYRQTSGIVLQSTAELAVDPHGLTLARARGLAEQFGLFRHGLATSSLGSLLECRGSALYTGAVSTGDTSIRSRCAVTSSLSSAVALANRDASQISPGVSLLSGAGTAIALAVAGAAGVFLVRRRSAEAALLYARGEHPVAYATRTGLELFIPTLIGAGAGFAVALGLTGAFAPSGSIDGGTVSSALARAGAAAAGGLVLGAVAASVLYVRQFDSGSRRLHFLRWLPWELPFLGVGLWLLVEVASGHGLAGGSSAAAGHPTLAVFVFPLLLVAAAAGIVMRLVRPLLKPRPGRGAGLPVAFFLALRRLSAARGLLTALFVVSAVAFGAYFYAQALAGSLDGAVSEKAYVAYGGDVEGLSSGEPLPRSFPYPLTSVVYGNQAATIGAVEGTPADVITVDPTTIGSVLRWFPDWGSDPRSTLGRLGAGGGTLDAVAVGDFPAGTNAIWLESVRIPVRVVDHVKTFPGMTPDVPLVVLSNRALEALAKQKHLYEPLGDPQSYLWAKGPPAKVARALEQPALGAYYVSTIDSFKKDPDVLLARRTFSYMRLIAGAAGVLVFIGLLLYLQARQRSQAVGSALAARMGLARRDEIASLSLELAAIAAVAAVVGGVVALAAAAPIVGHLDPLPDDPPVPVLALPWGAVVIAAVALVVLGLAAAAVTSLAARRTDMSKALRVV